MKTCECEYCGSIIESTAAYSFASRVVPAFAFDCLCRVCVQEWTNREAQGNTLGIPPKVMNNSLAKIAQEVTDEVFGQGSHAQVNGAPPLTIQEEPDGFDM